MAVIGWKDVYATGINSMDKEHRGLIEQINLLYDAVREKRDDEIIAPILSALEKYTVEHFSHEERLMAEYQYPGLEEHKEVHKALIAEIDSFKQRANSSTEELAKELLTFLRKWLLEHILKVDKEYGPFLESRGGRFID